MFVSFDTKVRYKGREYSTLDEIPPDIRRALDNFLHALLPIDTAICVAAARERKHAIRGVTGLSLLLVACVATAAVLWSRGYLFWLN